MELLEYYPHQSFKEIIIQNGGKLSLDRYNYTFRQQRGGGFGSFFAKLLNTVTPLAKRVGRQAINTGIKILKPHVQKIGNQALAVGTQIATDKVDQLSNKIQKKIASRKRSSATTSRKSKKPKSKDLFDG